MKKKILPGVFFILLLLSLTFTSPSGLSSKDLFLAKSSAAYPQDVPVKKTKYDYMSTILSRSTKPLGLKENLESKKLNHFGKKYMRISVQNMFFPSPDCPFNTGLLKKFFQFRIFF